MRLITVVILFISLCFGQVVQSQEPIYRWGDPCTNNNIERKIDQLLSLGDNGFVILRKHTDNTFVDRYWIEHYNGDLSLISTNEVAFSLGVMGDSYDIEEVAVLGDRVLVFVSHWDKGAGKNSLSVKELSMEGELNDLAEMGSITAQKMGNRGMFEFAYSDDQSKIAILYEMPFAKKTQERLELKCFDANSLELIWSTDKELKNLSKRAVLHDLAVDNKGRVFIYKRFRIKSDWDYTLYTYDADGSGWSESTIDVGENEILEADISFDKKNEMTFLYTYTQESSAYKRELHGFGYIHYNALLAQDVNETGPWMKDVVTYFSGERIAENPDKSRIDDFFIQDVLDRNDGKKLYVLEQIKTKNTPIAGSSPIQYTYEWDYKDLLILCVEPSTGDVVWWQAINKTQHLVKNEDFDEYGSYLAHLNEDRLFILWNNTELSVPSIPPANWTEPDGTRYVKHKAFHDKTVHATFMHVVEPDGVLAYENTKFGQPLFNLHNGAVFEMSLSTPFSFSLNGDLVVMSAMHNGGKRYRFGFIGL